MKKAILILIAGLLLSTNAYADADNNLRGIKEFNLLVDHNGCNKDNFSKEITTNTKYLISNSKIKLSDKAKEVLYLNIFSSSGEESGTPCASYIKLEVYSFGMVENSVGQERLYTRTSYKKNALAWHTGSDYEDKHRDAISRNFDQWIKEFIIDWSEAQN